MKLAAALVLVAFLGSGIFAQLPLRATFSGPANSAFGDRIAPLGDLDGDGAPDLAVVCPNVGTAVRVISGRTGALIRSHASAFRAGNARDIDGDGIDDVIVGNPFDSSVMSGAGSARVYSGATGAAIHVFPGPTVGDHFGSAVDGIGDVDLDGVPDLIIGWSLDDFAFGDSGTALVVSGSTGLTLHTLHGPSSSAHFGAEAAGIGDANADGVPDFAVAAPDQNIIGVASAGGRIYVYSGANAALLFGVSGTVPQEHLGFSVAAAGDLNGDGRADVLATTGTNGFVRAYSGQNGAVIFSATPSFLAGTITVVAAGAGDVNGDGVPDIVAGVRTDVLPGRPFGSGSAKVYSGADSSTLLTIGGPTLNALLGTAVAGIGDTDGDGFAEVAIGAPQGMTGASFTGTVSIYSVAGRRVYGVGADPQQTLSLDWAEGSIDPALGTASVVGALPFSPGILAAAAAGAAVPNYGTTILIDVLADLNYGSFGFDGNGGFALSAPLRIPWLAGTVVFVQAFSVDGAAPQGIFSSNGLELLFTR